jgi:hypothetical protein
MRRLTSSIRIGLRPALTVVSMIVLYSLLALAQATNNEIFAPIPEAQRSRLIERLNLLVEYQKTKQWAKQYDLLSPQMTRAESKRDYVNRTRQAYSKWGRAPLLEFMPRMVRLTPIDANQRVWFIVGCSQLLEKGQKINATGLVEAYWEKNDWFFSEVQNVGTGREDDPCSRATS